MKILSAVKVVTLSIAVAMSAHVSAAEAASTCKGIRREVKVTCNRAAEAVKRGGTSRAAQIRRATLQKSCKAGAKKFENSCAAVYCGYKMPECAEGFFCIQVVQTQTYTGLIALKTDGAKVLHTGACEQ